MRIRGGGPESHLLGLPSLWPTTHQSHPRSNQIQNPPSIQHWILLGDSVIQNYFSHLLVRGRMQTLFLISSQLCFPCFFPISIYFFHHIQTFAAQRSIQTTNLTEHQSDECFHFLNIQITHGRMVYFISAYTWANQKHQEEEEEDLATYWRFFFVHVIIYAWNS